MLPLCLEGKNLAKSYHFGTFLRKEVCIFRDLSLSIEKGKTMGITGKSGIGKTSLGKIMAGINQPTEGTVLYKGKDIHKMERREWRSFRRNVQMMFQNPEAALNPMKSIERQLKAVCKLIGIERDNRAALKITGLLDRVGLSPEILTRHPKQLSGGQNQRVALARILIVDPELIILDEPSSALDISVQAQILHLLKDIQKEKNLTYVYISHDRKVLDFMADATFSMDEKIAGKN